MTASKALPSDLTASGGVFLFNDNCMESNYRYGGMVCKQDLESDFILKKINKLILIPNPSIDFPSAVCSILS